MLNYDSLIEFYTNLGSKGMISKTSKSRDKKYLDFLHDFLELDHKILDIACGYGRLTIPLARKGYQIKGIDITPSLICDAEKFAKEQNVYVEFYVGNLCELPYENDSFDITICMWSSFSHILHQEEQIKALEEMYRVLRVGGFAIIDLPDYEKLKEKNMDLKQCLEKDRLYKSDTNDGTFIDYIHDETTLLDLLKRTKIKDYYIKKEMIDKEKLILYFSKG